MSLILILWIGYGLRLHTLQTHDAGIDEAFSFYHAYYLTHSDALPDNAVPGYYALAYEPNNALHLLLGGLFLSAVPNVIGLRWLSLMAGVVSIAATARIAHRLFRDDRITITAAFLAAIAYNPVLYSQLGRPYPLANCFGLLSLLFWLENRWKSNMLTGMLTALSHVGAMPLVILQDVLALWTVLRRKPFQWGRWIVSRIGIYGTFLMVIGLVHLRRLGGKIISGGESGQPIPTPLTLLDNLINALHGPQGIDSATLPTLLFLLGVVLPAVLGLGWLAYHHRLPARTAIPLLWLGVTDVTMTFMVVFGDGPIKFLHVMHVAFAYALLLAVVLVKIPRVLGGAILLALIVANTATLSERYIHPVRPFSEAMAALEVTMAGESVYYENESPVLTLTLNHPPADRDFLRPLPASLGDWPETFHFLAYRDWPPPLPTACDPEPAWTHGDFHVHECVP